MADPKHVAVIDVGKTNAKLALVDTATLEELAVFSRPNSVLPGPPWPHFDLEGHWQFFLEGLKQFHQSHGVDGISVTTHGASAVLLDADGGLAAPMLDYEHVGPDSVRDGYEKVRPPFSETGSAPLPMGLNLGAQLHWQFLADPGLLARTAHIVTYPQYWGYRLTGELASDVCSLGCHTDLWSPFSGGFSSLVDALGVRDRIAPPRRPGERLGTVNAEVAAATGLAPDTPVSCGIHDSNASLLPYLSGRDAPFSVVSTGTWVIAMAIGGAGFMPDPARDTLVNVDAFGEPVPSGRFMGGREYEVTRKGDAVPAEADRDVVLSQPVMLLPAVEPGSGPFQGRVGQFTVEPATDGQTNLALSYYLGLMTATCLELAGADGPSIVEGPFAANADYCAMLATATGREVQVAGSTTGTSVGSAMLLMAETPPIRTRRVEVADRERLAQYAEAWRAAVSGQA